MKRIHAIALTAATAALLSLGSAAAQSVSGGDPYNQGYAAGASAKERNTLNAFDSGYQAGQTAQSDVQTRSAGIDAYDKGYAAGVAQASKDREQAYQQGYEDRGQRDVRLADRAYDNGFDAGAYRRSHDELTFP